MRKKLFLMLLSSAVLMTGCAGNSSATESTTEVKTTKATTTVQSSTLQDNDVSEEATTSAYTVEGADGYDLEDYEEAIISKITINGATSIFEAEGEDNEMGFEEFTEKLNLIDKTDYDCFCESLADGFHYLGTEEQTGYIKTSPEGLWFDEEGTVVYVGEEANKDFKVGDKIISINGNTYNPEGAEELIIDTEGTGYTNYREFIAAACEFSFVEYGYGYQGDYAIYKDVEFKVTDADTGKEVTRHTDMQRGMLPSGIYVYEEANHIKSIRVIGAEMNDIVSLGTVVLGSTTRESLSSKVSEVSYEENAGAGCYRNDMAFYDYAKLLTVWYNEDGTAIASMLESL